MNAKIEGVEEKLEAKMDGEFKSVHAEIKRLDDKDRRPRQEDGLEPTDGRGRRAVEEAAGEGLALIPGGLQRPGERPDRTVSGFRELILLLFQPQPQIHLPIRRLKQGGDPEISS